MVATKIGLAISGFSTIKPKIVDVLICNDLGPGFLVGRKVLNDWNLSIHYKDGTETWQAGELTVAALTAGQAARYNDGLYEARNRALAEWRPAHTLVNPQRGESLCYQWSNIPQEQINPPPLGNTRVQSVQRQKELVPATPASAVKGNRSFAAVTAAPPPVPLERRISPNPNIENDKQGKRSVPRAGKSTQPVNPGNLSFAKAGVPSNASMQLPPKAGNTQGDILFRAASSVVLPPRSIRKIQVNYPALANPPTKKTTPFSAGRY